MNKIHLPLHASITQYKYRYNVLVPAAPVSVSVSSGCLAAVSHIKAPLCLKQAHLVWLMSLLATYVCVCVCAVKGL